MAVKINSGDLIRKIILKAPTVGKNDEGAVTRGAFAVMITTFGAVIENNEFRNTDPASTALLNTKDFYIRWSTDREDITLDWILTYKGEDYTIHRIESVEQRERFIRITGKSKGRTVSAGGSGGGSVTNLSTPTYNQLTGELTFTGDAGSYLTQLDFHNPETPLFGYINGEGTGFSVGSFEGLVAPAEYFTPGQVLIRWRRTTGAPSFTPVTGYNEFTLTVTRLSRRWLRIWRIVSGSPFEIYPGFPPLRLYNVAGAISGVVNDIDELVTLWNTDPANVHFQIIDMRTLNGFYEVQIEPHVSEIAYPVKYVKVEYDV